MEDLKKTKEELIHELQNLRYENETLRNKTGLLAKQEHLKKADLLIRTSFKVVGEKSLEGMLQTVVDAARQLTGAQLGASAHLNVNDEFLIGATSRAENYAPCPPEAKIHIIKGGVYLELINGHESIRLNDTELHSHPLWWGLPEAHVPLRGLLGVRLLGSDGRANGLIMLSDKEGGGDFTEEDENLLKQLAAVTSLALQHIEARTSAERRAAEAEEGRRTLAALMENIPAGIIIAEAPDVTIRMLSRYVRELAGRDMEIQISAEEHAKKSGVLHADGQVPSAGDLPLVRATRNGEVVTDEEWIVERPGGERIPILVNAGPIRDQSGRIQGGIVVWRDITALKTAREALKESEERFRIMADDSPLIIWVSNTEGRNEFVNRACVEFFGGTLEEFLGPNWQVLIHPEDAPEYLNTFFTALRERKPFRAEARVKRADGQWRWIESRSLPRFSSDGEYLGMVGNTVDITERKQAEEELVKARETAERRTRELEIANKEIESFSYSVSHDLRAPLRFIDGFSRALSEDYGAVLNETGRDYLNRVRSAAQKMNDLIDAMLSLSRLTRNDLVLKTVNCTALVREIASELKKEDPERQVEFAVEEGVTALADSALIRVVLDNLLRNAWKFTARHKTARIEFSTEKRGDETVYYVRDDGAGFDMQYAEMLFRAFHRLHSESEFPGIGIGLATVQRIIHRHSGHIWAEGEVEKGATFYFTLGKGK